MLGVVARSDVLSIFSRAVGVRHVPVRADDGRWVRLVSMRDVLGVLLDAADED